MKKTYIIIIGVIVLIVTVALLLISSKDSTSLQPTSHASVLKEAEVAFGAGELLTAKRLYLQELKGITDPGLIDDIHKKIETINMSLIFSSEPDECSTIYIVEPRDTLTKIAKKFKTTVNLIKRANNLTSDIIRPKQKLKVVTCQFSIVVDKSQNLLFLKRNSEVVKTYVVSTGKDSSTPVGEFTIDQNKLVNPTWYKTGAIIAPGSPENILGSRWMGLSGKDANGEDVVGYGIHGTTQPEDLGKQITLGCIRMRNEEVEELFDIVPTGTEVIIID